MFFRKKNWVRIDQRASALIWKIDAAKSVKLAVKYSKKIEVEMLANLISKIEDRENIGVAICIFYSASKSNKTNHFVSKQKRNIVFMLKCESKNNKKSCFENEMSQIFRSRN